MRVAKRALAGALALLMVLMLLPQTAWAATTHGVDTPEELAAALGSFASGDTIVLEGNIDYSTTAANKDTIIPLSITGMTVTFDLNGHTLNVSNATGYGLYVGVGGVVNTVDAPNTGAFNIASTCADCIGILAVDKGVARVKGNVASAGHGVLASTGGRIELDGDVVSNTDLSPGCGMLSGGDAVFAENIGSIVTVSGNARGSGDSFGVWAAYGGRVEVAGDATGGWAGVWARAESSVVVGRNAEGYTGVRAEYNSSVVVEGDVIATYTGVDAFTIGRVHVKGNIITEHVESNGAGVYIYDHGIEIEEAGIDLNGDASYTVPGSVITIDGNVTLSYEGDEGNYEFPLRGIFVSNKHNYDSFPVVRIGGDVTVSGPYAVGVEMHGGGGDENAVIDSGGKVMLDGNLTVTGAEAQGVYMWSSACTGNEARIRGNLTVNGTEAAGIHVYSDFEDSRPTDVSEKIVVDGALTVNDEDDGVVFWMDPVNSNHLVLIKGGVAGTTHYFISVGGDKTYSFSEYSTTSVTEDFETYQRYYAADFCDIRVRTEVTNPTISPVTAAFDKNPGMRDDVTTDITWNIASKVDDVKANGRSIGASNFSVEENTLTIDQDYLAEQAPGSLSLTILFDDGAPATLMVDIICQSASIDPSSGTFDREPLNQADVSTTITWGDASAVTDVKAGTVSIGDGYYSVSEPDDGQSILTISKDYLKTVSPATGNLVLTVEFNEGSSATLTIAILPVSATISPTRVAFNKFPLKGLDVTTTITWQDAFRVTDVKLDGVTIGGTNYTVVGTKLTIKKEYLAGLGNGDYVFTIEFARGASATLTIPVFSSMKSVIISPASAAFAAATVGYEAPPAQQFTITNTGADVITGLTAAFSGSNFEISTELSAASINSGGEVTVSVRPRTGLSAGTYTDTLTITGSGSTSLTASLSFTVSANDDLLYFSVEEGGGAFYYGDPYEDGVLATDLTGWSYAGGVLTLDGFEWTTAARNALTIVGGDLTIRLSDGSVNTIVSNFDGDGTDNTCGIFIEFGNLTIEGDTGSLTAGGGGTQSGDSAGIRVENGTLEIDGGNVAAMSNDWFGGESGTCYGIYAKDVILDGGTVNAETGDAGINCSGIYGEEGITINGGTVNAASGEASGGDTLIDGKGISIAISAASGNVLINGGDVTAISDGATNLTAGIGAMGDATDTVGSGSVRITDGTVTATAGNRRDVDGLSFGIVAVRIGEVGDMVGGSVLISGCPVTATGNTQAFYAVDEVSVTIADAAYRYWTNTVPTESGASGPTDGSATPFANSSVFKYVKLASPPALTAPEITTTTLPSGTVGTAYSQTLAATGDTPTTWSLDVGSDPLPSGLTLSSGGVISGTPTTEGTFNFTVKAENAAGSDTQALSIIIADTTQEPLEDATISPTEAFFNLDDPGDIFTTITWNDAETVTGVIYGSDPLELTDFSVNENTLTITEEYLSGLSLTDGETVELVISFDKGESATLTVTAAATPTAGTAPTITTDSLPGGTVGIAYSQTLAATGDTPITWSMADGSDPLPGGLMLSSGGVISGTPTTAGTFTFAVAATNAAGGETRELSIVVSLSPTYSLTIKAGTGGSITAGADGSYAQGAVITVAASANANYSFNKWTSAGGGSFANANSTSTTFTMPAGAATITAEFTYNGGGDVGGGGGGGVGGGTSPAYYATIEGGGKVSVSGKEPVSVNADTASAAVNLGRATAESIVGGGSTTVTVPSIPGVNSYTANLPSSSLSGGSGEGTLTLDTSLGSVTIPGNMFSGTGLTGDAGITIGTDNKENLPDEVKAALGDRPILQITLTVNGKQTSWSNDSAPVTVSIPYSPTAAELADPEHIVVWYIDGSGNAVSVPNGRYNPETGTVTFSTTHFSRYAVAYVRKTFGDLGTVEWARKPIEVMASKGIISGTSATTYSPSANITRADYLVLLIKTLGLTADFEDNFADVQPGAYYYEAVGIAKKLGITGGIGNNRLNPQDLISRQDMMVMTARALEKFKGLEVTTDLTVLDQFSDKSGIAGYAMESLATLVKEELIAGSGGRLNPSSQTNRAEAAVFLYRIYNTF